MRVQFIVQGEGRGHMTQALAMQHLLVAAGHVVEAVCIGTSDRREIPSFFIDKIDAPVTRFRSPNFVSGREDRGIQVGASLWQNLLKSDQYVKSLAAIHAVVQDVQPDLVVNFYEPLWGFYHKRYHPKVKSLCVAHQLLAKHRNFPFPPGRTAEKIMLTTLNAVTAAGSSRRLCLSFTPMSEPEPDDVDSGLVVVPPLLRPALFDLKPTDGDYILVYVMQAGYGEDIMAWHEQHPQVKMHCFWDREGAPEVERRSETLTFHRLSDVKFLEMMAGCRGLVTTAGFESICEAFYLEKPVLMVPVAGHYEQACNALDAQRAGAGIWSDTFDLDRFMEYISQHETDSSSFRTWVDSAPARILAEIEDVGGAG